MGKEAGAESGLEAAVVVAAGGGGGGGGGSRVSVVAGMEMTGSIAVEIVVIHGYAGHH